MLKVLRAAVSVELRAGSCRRGAGIETDDVALASSEASFVTNIAPERADRLRKNGTVVRVRRDVYPEGAMRGPASSTASEERQRRAESSSPIDKGFDSSCDVGLFETNETNLRFGHAHFIYCRIGAVPAQEQKRQLAQSRSPSVALRRKISRL